MNLWNELFSRFVSTFSNFHRKSLARNYYFIHRSLILKHMYKILIATHLTSFAHEKICAAYRFSCHGPSSNEHYLGSLDTPNKSSPFQASLSRDRLFGYVYVYEHIPMYAHIFTLSFFLNLQLLNTLRKTKVFHIS